MESKGVAQEEGEAAEVKWRLFEGDLKVSRMAIKHARPSVSFEIPILPRPPRYRPGDGPPPPRIDLQLVHDSDAFIVDKIVLPLEPFTSRQRRAYYIIGWPDLPAARPVIDCARALDYISPRTLEDWEYSDFLRREAERQQAEEEAREAEAAAAAAAPAKGKAHTDLLPTGKKKPGRKPKHAKGLHKRPPTPQLDSEQEEMLARRKHGPSLSTPSKSRIAQLNAEIDLLEGLEESSEDDAEGALQIQLENDVLGMDHRAKGLDVVRPPDGLNSLRPGDAVLCPESPPGASHTPGSVPRKETNLSIADSVTKRSATSAGIFNPQYLVAHAGFPAPTVSSQLSQSSPRKPISTTPVPLPIIPAFVSKAKPTASPSSLPTTILPSVETKTLASGSRPPKPTLSPSRPVGQEQSAQPSSSSSWPTPPGSNGFGGFTTNNTFMPTGSHLPRHPKRSAEHSPAGVTSVDEPSTKAKKKRQKTSHRVSPAPREAVGSETPAGPAQQEWVVKRLEGHQVVDGVHYFKVRWEGDWPPEENPSWEPKENISADLVKRYLKREAKREAKKAKKQPVTGSSATGGSGKPRDKQQETLAPWARRYNSVSEAFEGRPELDETADHHGSGGAPDETDGLGQVNDDDEADEVLVVDEKHPKGYAHAAAERNKNWGAQLAAQFGRRSEF